MIEWLAQLLGKFGLSVGEAIDFVRIGLSVLAGILGVAFAFARFAYDHRKRIEDERRRKLEADLWRNGDNLQERLDAAIGGLKDALQVINGLETHIKARAKSAARLRDEIEQYKGVQAVQKEQVDAIAAVLSEQLKLAQREDQKVGLKQDALMNTFFMLLGAVISYFIAKWLGG